VALRVIEIAPPSHFVPSHCDRHAWTLDEYYWVLHMDIDAYMSKNVDELLDQQKDFIYTKDYGMGGGTNSVVQGGWLLLRPNRTVFDDILTVFKRGNFGGGGWEKSGVGYAWGGPTVQGLTAYYFYRVAAPTRSMEVDMCVWNNMGDERCRDKAEDIRNSHFTVCPKPWTCSSPGTPACTISSGRWWAMYSRLRIKEGLQPRDSCDGGRYVPIHTIK
jgi:hypothetical protein